MAGVRTKRGEFATGATGCDEHFVGLEAQQRLRQEIIAKLRGGSSIADL